MVTRILFVLFVAFYMSLTDYQSYIHTLLDNPTEEETFFGALDQPLHKSLHLLQSRINTAHFLSQNP
jgi:hypothetical protein